MFIGNPNLKATKRTKPIQSALCKSPVQGIVVAAKPVPNVKPAPLPAPKPQLNGGRPEHLQPLSKVTVPIARANDRVPVVRCTGPIASVIVGKPINNAKAIQKPKGPQPRLITAADMTLRESLADQVVDILRSRIKTATKVTLIRFFDGAFPAGAIAAGIRIAVRRGAVSKDETCKPSRYAFVPIPPPVNDGWTNQL